MSLRVNADYESVLFQNRPSLEANQVIEFLAFFLERRPVLSSKSYSENYLNYVEHVTGFRPSTSIQDIYENWWGKLEDVERERKLNSKITSTEFLMEKNMISDTKIVRTASEILNLNFPGKYLLKDPFSMSGRGFKALTHFDEAMRASQQVAHFPLIAEPLLERTYDFSHYVFPDGKVIAYQNVVDEKFQYKGSVFNDWKKASIENFSFYDRIPVDAWKTFSSDLETIVRHYQDMSRGLNLFGFSLDSFIYRQDNEFKIRTLSEVNFRRTMGRVAYELAARYAGSRSFASLILEKSFKDRGGFARLKERLEPILLTPEKENGIIILSPGDTRFEIFFVSAEDTEAGMRLQREMRRLLT